MSTEQRVHSVEREVAEVKGGIGTITSKLDQLHSDLADVKSLLKSVTDRLVDYAVWKERIEGRLTTGAECFNCIEKDVLEVRRKMVENDKELANSVETLDRELHTDIHTFKKEIRSDYVSRRELQAWAIGAALGSGGIVASLMKLLE